MEHERALRRVRERGVGAQSRSSRTSQRSPLGFQYNTYLFQHSSVYRTGCLLLDVLTSISG